MKTRVINRNSLIIVCVFITLISVSANFWQYYRAKAVKIETIPTYVSVETSLAAGSSFKDNSYTEGSKSVITEKTPDLYEIEYPESGSKIEIGDVSKTGGFKPDLIISSWDKEAEFKLISSNSTVEKSQFTTSLKDGAISSSNGEWTFEYKPTEQKDGFNDKGGLDILITAKEKPSSNRIEFTFDSSTVTPYYQPPLTEEYTVGKQEDGTTISSVSAIQVIDDKGNVIAERPDYVVNSIAFYANDKENYEVGKNNYATGKVGHLYAMKVGESWVGWILEGKKLILTIPQEILDKSEYPLTITPVGDTFGYTTAGGSYNTAYNRISGSGMSFSPTQDGVVTSMSVYTYGYTNAQLALSTGTLYGSHTILGHTGDIDEGGAAPAEWVSGNLASSVQVYSSTSYYLLYNQADAGAIYYDSAGGSNFEAEDQTYGIWPSPVSLINYGTISRFSIYCTYTPLAGTSISNTPSSFNFGEVTPNNTISTGLNYFTVTNNSASAVKITISGTDITGGTTWTLSDTGTAGTSTAGIKAGLNGASYNIVIKKTAPYNTLISSLASSASQLWGFQLLSPTNYTDAIQKSGIITLTATTP